MRKITKHEQLDGLALGNVHNLYGTKQRRCIVKHGAMTLTSLSVSHNFL